MIDGSLILIVFFGLLFCRECEFNFFYLKAIFIEVQKKDSILADV
jgi:hypothetical protein